MIRNAKTSNEVWNTPPQNEMIKAAHKFVSWLKYKNYSPKTIFLRCYYLGYFLAWCNEYQIDTVEKIDILLLEKYQRHLANCPSKRSKNGLLSPQACRAYLVSVRVFTNWLTNKRYIKKNPAEELQLGKRPQALPKTILSNSQIEHIINQTDVTTPLGIRDRAILEVLYSTGIRASELIHLSIYDIDPQQEILIVREGKGRKDRIIPIGTRACHWVEKYKQQVRPSFVNERDEKTLFLTRRKKRYTNVQSLIYLVNKYIKKSKVNAVGSCHIFRHAMSVQMIRNGASTRYIQEILGHRQISTTQIYTKVTIEDLQRVYTQFHPRERDND